MVDKRVGDANLFSYQIVDFISAPTLAQLVPSPTSHLCILIKSFIWKLILTQFFIIIFCIILYLSYLLLLFSYNKIASKSFMKAVNVSDFSENSFTSSLTEKSINKKSITRKTYQDITKISSLLSYLGIDKL